MKRDDKMDWKDYEDNIYEKFYSEFGNTHELIKNTRVKGIFSKIKRQVDILIKSKIVGYGILGVIECKYFSKKINVKTVDSFIGFLEDVGANFGVIITNKGFTPGAKNRAEVKGIRLDIIDFNELDNYHYDMEFCQICEPGDDTLGGVIWYDGPIAFKFNDIAHLVEVGRCDYCNCIHINCNSCGYTIPVYESDYDELLECCCEIRYIVTSDYDRDDIQSNHLYIFNPSTLEKQYISRI
jgi:hypothetical protein